MFLDVDPIFVTFSTEEESHESGTNGEISALKMSVGSFHLGILPFENPSETREDRSICFVEDRQGDAQCFWEKLHRKGPALIAVAVAEMIAFAILNKCYG
jgi:hypothetical protein